MGIVEWATQAPTTALTAEQRVAHNIRAIRTSRGFSVRALSDRLRVVGRPLLPSAISDIENMKRRVDVDDLMALAIALDVRAAELLERYWD